jgi:interferon, gamma-inducible protein 30
VTDYLIPTASIPGMKDIMKVTYVPFGNAKIDLDAKTVTCQHGDTECFANSYEQCAIDIYPDQDDFLPFVGCVAAIPTQFKMSQDSSFEACAESAGLDFGVIKTCHDDPDRAWDLQVSNSELTPADHEYTPWIVVDGELYDNSSHDLQKAVCDAYAAKGGDGGDACKTAVVML